MTFDPGFNVDKYADAYANNDDNRPDLEDEDEVDGEHEIRGDRYRGRGASLFESAVLRVVDQQKRIESADLSEEYARQLENVLNRFERKWKEKEQVKMSLPTTFPGPISPKEEFTFKGGSRKRAPTAREAADAAEIDEIRQRHHVSLE